MSSPSSPEALGGTRGADPGSGATPRVPARPIDAGTLVARLAAGPALLDVRDAAAFAAGHVAGSGWLPAPLLEERRNELPPRDRPVVVVAADAAAASEAAATLGRLGYRDVAWLDAPPGSLGARAGSTAAPARLWQPNAFLASIVEEIPLGRAADLAAGAGREAVFLALAGFEVEAWDEAPEALARARDHAGREGVALATHVANLEARSFTLPPARYALVTCFRFLHRPLFPVMAAALAPGGHLVYETYRLGQERFGRPRRRQFLLDPGELERSFRALGLEILRFEEAGSEAEGALTQRIWARKPSSSAGAAVP